MMKGFAAAALAMLIAASVFPAGKSPLADAAEKSDRATIRTLLKQHDDVNALERDASWCMRSAPEEVKSWRRSARN